MAVLDSGVTTRSFGLGLTYDVNRAGTSPNKRQHIAVLAQGQTGVTFASTPVEVTNPEAVGAAFGWRSPAYHICKLLLPRNTAVGAGAGTRVTLYPLGDHASGVAAAGSITPSGTATRAATFRVVANGRWYSDPFVVPAGSVVVADVIAQIIAAVAANIAFPGAFTNGTTLATFTAALKGTTGNGITLSVVGDTDAGVSFAISQPASGATDPDVDATVFDRSTTLVVNQFAFDDETILDALQTEGEVRWGPLERRPFCALTGNTEAAVADAYAVSTTRRDDRINAYAMANGSADLAYWVCAHAAAQIARIAASTPAVSYAALPLQSVQAGSTMWTQAERQAARDNGCSSVVWDENGMVELNDVLTFYRPEGEEPPGYAEVVNIIKAQNILDSGERVFSQREWASAPLVSNDAVVRLPEAKRAKDFKAAWLPILQSLESRAILYESALTFAAITVAQDTGNPMRVNGTIPITLSPNANVIDMELPWAFVTG